MHKLLIILALAVLLLPAAAAANEGSSAPKPTFGGIGFTTVGVGAVSIASVGAPLQAAFGDNGNVGPASWRYGGGGKMLLFGLVLGGKGYGFNYTEGSGAAGTAHLSGGGGGFDLGYAIHRSAKALVYPFVGFGGYGIDLEVENTSDADFTFGDGVVAKGGTTTFESGYWAVEVGVGAQWLLMYGGDGGQGGWALGAELGLQMSVVSSAWEGSGGAEIDGIAAPKMLGGFLWIHLGGGGFYLR